MGVQNAKLKVRDREKLLEQKKREIDYFTDKFCKMKDTLNKWDLYVSEESCKNEKAYINEVSKEMNTLVDRWFCMTKRMESVRNDVEGLRTILTAQSKE